MADRTQRTYGVTWYVEVDATDEADAAARARKFLAPRWRDNWEPLAVEVIESDEGGGNGAG